MVSTEGKSSTTARVDLHRGTTCISMRSQSGSVVRAGSNKITIPSFCLQRMRCCYLQNNHLKNASCGKCLTVSRGILILTTCKSTRASQRRVFIRDQSWFCVHAFFLVDACQLWCDLSAWIQSFICAKMIFYFTSFRHREAVSQSYNLITKFSLWGAAFLQ